MHKDNKMNNIVNETSKNIIIDITEDQFADLVIEKSKEHLILVDFWAPWCGPCKQLTPLLEKIINTAKGKVHLVKINIDENQQIASQLRVQSIPAVFAFKDGAPIDAFQGILPENKIISFIEKSLGQKLIKDNSDFYKTIELLISENKFDESIVLIEGFISENPEEYKAIALYLDCLTNQKKYTETQNLYDSLSDEAKKDKNLISSFKKFIIKKEQSEGPSLKSIEDQFNQNKNIDMVLKLTDKYFAESMYDECFSLLLSHYGKNKEPIKEKFIKLFDALGNSHEKTIFYRKKFSSIMFS